MKLTFLFFTLLIFVSSCTSILIKESSGEETASYFNPAESPFDPYSLNHELKQDWIGYCFDCARACMRRGKYIKRCNLERRLCRCSISKIH
ncbi:hypothetical protein ARALYDRAFT_333429 [Arabidopsis lyrata subsp. lyrata]|uniref:Uncharacterized protein n=1 Tax=Arabidopsis lyrata subsp. lyrata TaxID=81972 RepID=D7MYF6_ARALL|nr:protein LURE 1.3 [Arabidopsis lyrata subsp. lyrata]EFH38425.1 hypothetical protein ARALYDRAFT_333429 [Arabidopsis lyrata subsp. lyrata]|eukprot:XP_002862167.1 protein LURE 1.3 [Arabidopsis lyrata subsp. lyrata]